MVRRHGRQLGAGGAGARRPGLLPGTTGASGMPGSGGVWRDWSSPENPDPPANPPPRLLSHGIQLPPPACPRNPAQARMAGSLEITLFPPCLLPAGSPVS